MDTEIRKHAVEAAQHGYWRRFWAWRKGEATSPMYEKTTVKVIPTNTHSFMRAA